MNRKCFPWFHRFTIYFGTSSDGTQYWFEACSKCGYARKRTKYTP